MYLAIEKPNAPKENCLKFVFVSNNKKKKRPLRNHNNCKNDGDILMAEQEFVIDLFGNFMRIGIFKYQNAFYQMDGCNSLGVNQSQTHTRRVILTSMLLIWTSKTKTMADFLLSKLVITLHLTLHLTTLQWFTCNEPNH